MQRVSHNVKFMIKVSCLGLYMHHLVFWNKLLSGKSICILKVFNCLYELEQYIINCNNVRTVIMLELLTKSAIQHRSDVLSRFSYFLQVGNDRDTLHS